MVVLVSEGGEEASGEVRGKVLVAVNGNSESVEGIVEVLTVDVIDVAS